MEIYFRVTRKETTAQKIEYPAQYCTVAASETGRQTRAQGQTAKEMQLQLNHGAIQNTKYFCILDISLSTGSVDNEIATVIYLIENLPPVQLLEVHQPPSMGATLPSDS